ncbi:ATPase family AAA domain-containing protein 2 isoform X2 [Copidosoma floridanum]|nr:ATPase family AAA domain-containing protein 2 isoform X2 [Copidosoma floridanum]
MTDDDALDTMDTEDTEEEIYSRKVNDLKAHNNNSPEVDQNGSLVRRSTRHKSQTYDNLNQSWIFGTQTLKGYPTYNKHDSSSDKEMADEAPSITRRLRRRQLPLKSSCKNSSRHLRTLDSHSSSRGLRGRPSRRSVRNIEEMPDRERGMREPRKISELRSLRSRSDYEHELKNGPQLRVRDKTERFKIEPKDKTANEERESKPVKMESPCRSRDGPVTRFSNSHAGKNDKPKLDEKERNNDNDVDNEDDDDDNSPESEKAENNDNSDNDENEGYEDMYTRVKRTRRVSQRQLQKRQLAEDSDLSDSSDGTPSPRKYSLRQKKPVVDRFQINAEQPRRSMRVFRTVFSNSIRRRKRRSESSSSSDSCDSEPQRYEKKSKKSRQSAIPQGGSTDQRADISPISVDTSITFNDVGGLESHIHCLKEMVVFPMVYPEVFDRFHLTPPKGVLFHGPPGTGKTLLARALANECSKGSRKVSFFMRKGADCLTKWVGESERQLRLLFEQAQQMKPSIIFFDEIDGLAPVRSTKQDQIHASIVSTLLALMDGLSDRGEVILIGATNRIDAIDPALRRPGRFDRELFFPLPAAKERLEIMKIHVNKWSNPPADYLLESLAEKATGYCGSDLKALCTEAVIQSLKRTYPQIYKTNNRLLLSPERVEVKKLDFTRASMLLVPASHRVTSCVGRRLESFVEPLLESSLQELLSRIRKIFPQGTNHELAKLKVTKGVHRPRLLISGGDMARNQATSLAKAVIFDMDHLPVHTLNVSTLFAESARSPEEACVQVFNEATRNMPSIIYIASVDQWWPLVPETVKAVFLCRIASLDMSTPILILATSELSYEELPDQLKNLFSELCEEIHSIEAPTEEERTKFFKPLFMVQSLRVPQTKKKRDEVLEELPLAPDPEPKKLTDEEKRVIHEKEEISLRELRIFLREICAKLARNRQFFMFTKPVDTEEVPDYNKIIVQPMDLETMMTKIDMHCYLCARDFLDDIDLICRNALEYNPDRDPADKLIRHRACSLRDNAYALIKAELDSDFEDKCRKISTNRKTHLEGDSKKKESPKSTVAQTNDRSDKKDSGIGNNSIVVNGKKLPSSRKRRGMWARGYVKKIKKKKISFEDSSVHNSEAADKSEPGDHDKSQELEVEEHGEVMNGHMPADDNTDTDSLNELSKETPPTTSETEAVTDQVDKTVPEPKSQNELESMEVSPGEDDKPRERSESRASSTHASLSAKDLSFTLDDLEDSDSSLAINLEESDKILVDRAELEQVFTYTVQATKNFSIESLCDVHVRLSRRIALYSRTYDRKSLPKDLLEDVKRFEIQ